MSGISVIIPTYNRKELLKKTLHSVFDQNLKADEIIVVDNESTDGTYEWLQTEWKDQVVAVQNKGIKSPGAARNLGLRVSTGSFIKFFDSDDLMTSNTLKMQLRVLSSSAKGFVYSPYFHASENADGSWQQLDPVILNYFPFSNSKTLTHWMVRGLFITIPGMLFKRELLETVGEWRGDVIASEDWDLLFRLSMEEPFPAHTNECAFLYRVHGQQTVGDHFNDRQRDLDKVKVLKDVWSKYIKKGPFTLLEKQLFRNKFYQISRRYAKADFPEANDHRKWYDDIIWQWYRLDQKLGRLKTKSAWQPQHGPLHDERKFKEYLEMIV